jgi:hypothetical protein
MLAAMFDLAWIDIAVAVYVAVLLVAVVTVLRIGNRRQAAS